MSNNDAEELFFDALDAAEEGGYAHRGSGIVDMQAADIVKALLAAGWTPPSRRQMESNLVMQVDTITFHRATYGHDLGEGADVDTDSLSDELAIIDVGEQTFISYGFGQDMFVYAVAWRGEVPVWRFRALDLPAGSRYHVGPLPLPFRMSQPGHPGGPA